MHTSQRIDQLQRQLAESFQSLYDSFVDPREMLWDDPGPWTPIAASGAAAVRVPLASEQQLAEVRDQCRALAVENEFAINGHENRISYLVGAGHTYRVTPRNDRQVPAELCRVASQVIDEFIAVNHWHSRQQEFVRRQDRDGEVFLRFFAAAGGQLRVRFVEPAEVATPRELASDPASSFGIVTDPQDVEMPLAYYVNGQAVDASQIQHRKTNVDRNVKRGLPLFYPVRKNLRRAEKLLRNMSIVAEIQSAIALIRKHRNSTLGGVQQLVACTADASSTSATGKTTHFRAFGPGTILDSHGGIEYDFPAAGLNAASFVTILQAELRAIASRLVMPEFMLTSDASNANYSSTMMAEGPALRMFARLQAELVASDRQVIHRVLATAVAAGRLPREVLSDVTIEAAPPTLEVRDPLKEVETLRVELECGILSPQTWSLKRGLDYELEQANLRAYREREKS